MPGLPTRARQQLSPPTIDDDPPLRIQLGSDSVRRLENKLNFMRAELERLRGLSESTDFPDIAAS